MSLNALKGDLLKIEQFISRYGYKTGLALTVNTDRRHVDQILNHGGLYELVENHLPNAEKIVWMWKESPDAKARTRPLHDILTAGSAFFDD